MVSRYFHIRPVNFKKKYNGATVKVTGDLDYPGQVDVQVVFCSNKDLYCKKTGRDLVDVAKIKIVPLRYLPSELARIEDGVVGVELENKMDFLFALRYFLPKE